MKIISSDAAPLAIGTYSQAVQVDNFIFLSGQIGLDPKTLTLVSDQFEAQTTQIFENMKQIALSANVGLNQLVKLTIFLQDLANFDQLNIIMQKTFHEPFPARSVVQISKLPKNALIEIEAIFHIS